MKGYLAPGMSTGGNMHEPKDLSEDTRSYLDSLGADPLAGSGFEQEPPEPEFESGEEE
jgi:hypothetical protein